MSFKDDNSLTKLYNQLKLEDGAREKMVMYQFCHSYHGSSIDAV